MRLVYFGTAPFAVPALRAVAGHVALVVSQPDRPSGRGMRLQPSPVKLAAQELGLPVETPERCRAPEFVERVRALKADALLVAAYGQILSVALLESAKRGGMNLHGSILPRYRGAAPIQRAILAGEQETGVALMQMDKGMDSGDVIDVRTTPIGADETAGELTDRLAAMAAEMAAEWMPRIGSGDYPRTPQNHEAATFAPKIERTESELSTSRPADEEYRRFRAFTPSPGVFVALGEGPLKVLRARTAEASLEPGSVAVGPDGLMLGFSSGALRLEEVQPPGKRRMSGLDYANGARLRSGDRLV